jgi:plasmid stabilization system protein ParE
VVLKDRVKAWSKKLSRSFKEVTKSLSVFPELGREIENRTERFFVKDEYQIVYPFTEAYLETLHV